MVKRNKRTSKKRYIRFQPGGPSGLRVEQYFGLSHMYDGRRLDSVPEGTTPRRVEPLARREHIEPGSPRF